MKDLYMCRIIHWYYGFDVTLFYQIYLIKVKRSTKLAILAKIWKHSADDKVHFDNNNDSLIIYYLF